LIVFHTSTTSFRPLRRRLFSERPRRSSRRDIKPSIARKVPRRLKVAHTLHAASHNINVVEREIAARSLTAQDIVVLRTRSSGARDVRHGDIADDDAVGGNAGWAAVEVVLLDVDAVLADIRHEDVFVDNAADDAGGVVVRLDARAGLAVGA